MKKIILILIFFVSICNYSVAENKYNVYSYDNYSFKTQQIQEKIVFLVDFSNSMNEPLNGKRKIDIALDALAETLPKISKNTYMGLRIYGHKSAATMINSCMATQLVVPVKQNSANEIFMALKNFEPIGVTPITYSIKQSLKYDFGLWQGKKRIIILTDGGENCDESPCEYILKLIKNRNDVVVDVIALSINDNDAISQLKCVSMLTKGKFYTADMYSELVNSLKDSFNVQKSVEGKIIAK